MMASLPPPESSSSFWHSEPSEFLLGHRSSKDLPPHADIVIVGSGITGASVARYLTEDVRAKNLSIVMLDAREACWCATGRNGGHCQALLLESSPDVAAFEVRNVETVKAYVEENNVPCEWRSLAGCRTFWTEVLAEDSKEDLRRLKASSPELASLVEFIQDEKGLQEHKVPSAAGAMLTVAAASLWPYKLVAFILEKAIKAGRLNLQTKTPVTSISASSDASDINSYHHEVNTDRGSIKAKHIVLATNAYTSHLLPEFAELIVPERGVMSALFPPEGMERLNNSYGFVGAKGASADHDDYLIQRPFSAIRSNDYLNQRPFANVPNKSGHLMFGGGKAAAKLNAIGETDDTLVDEGCATYLRRMLLEYMTLGGETKGLEELEAAQQWSGVWGTSRDSHPWVGAVPDRPGVWLSGGYTGHGMPNATLCGKAVVEMLLGEESSAPLEYVTERLVRTGNLPQAYIITKDRMERCKTLDSVRDQDEKMEVEAKARHESWQVEKGTGK